MRISIGLVLLALCSACATQQSVPVSCLTQEVEIFVDKQLVDGNPEALQLSVDEPHVVYIKAEGFVPQRFVLEPEPGEDGELRLAPENLCVQLVPVAQNRALEVEIDDPAAPAASP